MLVELGSTFYFWVQTESSSGVVTAPDSSVAPAYKVYQGGSNAAMAMGNMSGPVDSNTGFYKGSFAASSGNGFERGGTYVIRITYTITSTRHQEITFTVV